jgi:flavin reductase (DIM6/NTAB) family NADH-FMN oxidoreductase RutF
MLKSIDVKKIRENPFVLLDDEWALVAAGNKDRYNMMTVSWGGLGVLWNYNVATIYIRPSRYTRSFIDQEKMFSLSFFGSNKEIHKICGFRSGREIDKTAATGLTPVFEDGAVYFREAELVLICRKIYETTLDNTRFFDSSIEEFYKDIPGDYHKIYIGEIVKAYRDEGRKK